MEFQASHLTKCKCVSTQVMTWGRGAWYYEDGNVYLEDSHNHHGSIFYQCSDCSGMVFQKCKAC